jgi:phosphate/phosphite/phosphonate ABC transporter binding protein
VTQGRARYIGLPLSSQAEPADLTDFLGALRDLTGETIYPIWLRTYDDFMEAASASRLDLAWCPPVIALDLEQKGVAKAVLAVGRSGALAYYGAFVTQRSSGINRTVEMAGKRIAWVSPLSAAGYLVPRLYLAKKGIVLSGFFSEERFAGTHHGALELLLDGKVDAAAMYAHGDPQDPTKFQVPGPERLLRILSTAGPIPNDVIIARTTLDVEERNILVGALLALKEPALAPLRSVTSLTRFEPIPLGHLDPLKRLAQARTKTG